MDHQWVGDLVEVQPLAKCNRGYRYLQTVMAILLKFAWVHAHKAKAGMKLVKAFEKILREGHHTSQLQTDQRKEFYNKIFQGFLEKEGIHHYSTHGEHFHRTLKERMHPYFTSANM